MRQHTLKHNGISVTHEVKDASEVLLVNLFVIRFRFALVGGLSVGRVLHTLSLRRARKRAERLQQQTV